MASVNQIVTENILKMIQSGEILSWEQAFIRTKRNVNSKKNYSLLNQLMLSGDRSELFITPKKAGEIGLDFTGVKTRIVTFWGTVDKVIDGEKWAYGRFTTVDEDMLELTEEEISQLPEIKIPNISLRQCRELLILTNRFDDVENILASLPESTDEEKATKRILTNYWEYSTDFERDHKSLGLITGALGMTEDEVDDFFIAASKL